MTKANAVTDPARPHDARERQTSYSLLDEEWIPCLLEDGSVRSFGLKQIFVEAPRVRDIVGELPTQTFTIARLLLAILHQALDGDLENNRHWGELWGQGLPVAEVHDYLEEFRDRFDLLHTETPFYQVAGLHTAKNEVKGVAALLFDVPSNFRLFSGRLGTALDALSFAEATRWLVHTHAYDVSGIHSGMVGDPRVKGGKGYGIGTGWAGELGGVLVEGNNLSETLLLNLMPRSGGDLQHDVPPWERASDTAAPRASETPRGTVDLFTWQSRRVRLVHDGEGVIGCLIGNGDKILPQNLHQIEPLTPWRFSKPQTQKNKGLPVFMPRRHLPGRALWRGISGLVVHRAGSGAASGPPPGFPPPVLNWLLELQEIGALPDSQFIAPRAIGVEYGTQSSVVTDVLDDRLYLPLAALDADRHPELSACVREAVETADKAVIELGRLAGNLAMAAGSEAEGPTNRTREEGFAALDLPFRVWLQDLDVKVDVSRSLNRWKGEAERIVRGLAKELVDASGPAAWKGRIARRLSNEQLLTTSIAQGWFELGLKRILTQFEPDETPKGEVKKEGIDG